ncbi:MAG: hypothetical protein LBI70_01925 [Rickettsiales bacterium]|nr:hypothetical protein [Rickettsiales bacterium]
MRLGGRVIVFFGDLGRTDDDVLYNPSNVTRADYILCESTYGGKVHVNSDQKETLAQIINKTIARNGSIIIPAFAVGRTQLILYYIYQLKKQQKIPQIPIFVDSPMSIKSCVFDYGGHRDIIFEHRQSRFLHSIFSFFPYFFP